MELAFGIIGATLFVVFIVYMCTKEIKKNFYNPLPKVENGDKRISEIKIAKTRTISSFPTQGYERGRLLKNG